ncbi:hypothetical protein B0O80DRAFT_247773 [Mortierella sp. GBAus27b]|nr:hypothetical protein B0O80DRAFT_247773 [Mortierella sp. GBAus27b]
MSWPGSWHCVYLCRFQRDIPMALVASGVEHSKMRELASSPMDQESNAKCMDVRAVELGLPMFAVGQPGSSGK